MPLGPQWRWVAERGLQLESLEAGPGEAAAERATGRQEKEAAAAAEVAAATHPRASERRQRRVRGRARAAVELPLQAGQVGATGCASVPPASFFAHVGCLVQCPPLPSFLPSFPSGGWTQAASGQGGSPAAPVFFQGSSLRLEACRSCGNKQREPRTQRRASDGSFCFCPAADDG